jgi:flagellin
MGMTVNNQTNGVNPRQLHGVNRQVRTSMERLTSGHRINDASDDAAGLAVAMLMASDVAGQQQAVRNATDGMSMARVADGAMGLVSDNLVRMRELATQASSGTLSEDQRQIIAEEYNALAAENGRIAESTEFNGQQLLAGGDGAAIHVGGEGEQDAVIVPSADLTSLGGMTMDPADPDAAMDELESASQHVASARAETGAAQNRLESTIENLRISAESTAAARSRIMDADIAHEKAAMTRNMVMQQANIAMQTQANVQAGQVVSLLG